MDRHGRGPIPALMPIVFTKDVNAAFGKEATGRFKSVSWFDKLTMTVSP